MVVAGYSTIHELYDRDNAIHILAIMNSITVLAPSFGPLFGALLLYVMNWRGIFMVLAVWAMVTILGLFFKMPETKQEQTEAPSVKNILSQYKNILINKEFLLLTSISLSLFSAMIAWLTSGPFILVNTFHLKTVGFGVVQMFVFGSYIMGNRFVKTLTRRFSKKGILKFGLTLSLVGGFFAFTTSYLWPNFLWGFIAGMMFLTAGAGFVSPILNRLAIEAVNASMASKVAVASCLMGGAGILGSAVVSALYNGALISIGGIIFLFSVLAVVLQFFNRQYNYDVA